MAANEKGLSGDALKRAQAYNSAMEKAAKSMEQQQKLVNQLSTTFAGIGGNEFFRNLGKIKLKGFTNFVKIAIVKNTLGLGKT